MCRGDYGNYDGTGGLWASWTDGSSSVACGITTFVCLEIYSNVNPTRHTTASLSTFNYHESVDLRRNSNLCVLAGVEQTRDLIPVPKFVHLLANNWHTTCLNDIRRPCRKKENIEVRDIFT